MIARDAGDRSLRANLLRDLGEVALTEEAYAEAAALFGESLACYRAVGHPWSMARCLDALADITLRQGEAMRTARLLGAAAALRATIDVPLMAMITSASSVRRRPHAPHSARNGLPLRGTRAGDYLWKRSLPKRVRRTKR